MKKLCIKLLIIMAIGLSALTSITHAKIKRVIQCKNKSGTPLLIIGETHDSLSIFDFTYLLKIIDRKEDDFFYLLEEAPDNQKHREQYKKYIDDLKQENPGYKIVTFLLADLCINHLDKENAQAIDCEHKKTALNLTFPLAELFKSNAPSEKIEEFFLKLGDLSDEEIRNTVLHNSIVDYEFGKKLGTYGKFLQQILKTRGADSSSYKSFFEKFIADYKNKQDVLVNYLQMTPNGMKNRNDCMAKHIANCKSQKNVICIVGDEHLNEICSILKNKYEYEIESTEEITETLLSYPLKTYCEMCGSDLHNNKSWFECDQCLITRYCSKNCQIAHRSDHEQSCRKWSAHELCKKWSAHEQSCRKSISENFFTKI